ncbi:MULTISPECIES: hypothetical protein [unclassified Pseudoalteromonas]|uniref:hypothetical protein n=1 Tax=unclassified Pseudoalteromonas TaxID=194690 RepID=UPI0015FA83C3|nr:MULTISPECIES: hypothetical protein [unclassified Pseudoalteromonas]MBB1291004.1 hypothetical protein [Pseudoalteromonas sp. SR41-5]MBB1415294.1 hypothetical protein [Pseudoalteromonas sp. SG43-8]
MTLTLLLLSGLSADVTPANVNTQQLKGTGGIIILNPKPKPKIQGTGGIIILNPKKPK